MSEERFVKIGKLNINERVGNRLYGLALVTFGSICASTGSGLLLILSSPMIIEGVGDSITGEHHYLGSRLLNYLIGLPKD